MKPPIGQHLQRLREGADMTRADVATKAHVSERTVLNVEKQKFPPSLETLQRIATVFKHTVILSSRAR